MDWSKTLTDLSAWVGGTWALINLVWLAKKGWLTPIPAEHAAKIRSTLIKARTITSLSLEQGGKLSHPWYLDRKTPTYFAELADELDAAIALIGRWRQLRVCIVSVRDYLQRMQENAPDPIYVYGIDQPETRADRARALRDAEKVPMQLAAATAGSKAVEKAIAILDRRTRKF
jgi:hypothetical protein